MSGHLFFEFTSCQLGRRVLLDVNHTETDPSSGGGKRVLLISSDVDWHDDPLDPSRHESGDDNGEYRVVLFASAGINDQDISGEIYLIPANRAGSRLDTLCEKALRINQLINNEEDISGACEDLARSILEGQAGEFSTVDFTLDTRGFIGLSLRNRSAYSDISEYTLTRQAYYYAKYAWHKHQHHSHTAESLTTIHLNQSEKGVLADQLIVDLKRSLVQLKRDFYISDYRSLFHAEGIATYAASLIMSCQRAGYLSQEAAAEQKVYFDNVSASLKVKASSIEKELISRSVVANNFRAVILFAISILAPLTIIYSDAIKDLIDKRYPNSSGMIPETLAVLYGSEWHLLALSSVALVVYFGYRQAYLKYGAALLVFPVFRRWIGRIVRDAKKAHILSWLIIWLGITVMLVGLYSLAH